MSGYLLQPGFRRGRRANRVGVAFLVFLLLVLIASLVHGLRSLGAV